MRLTLIFLIVFILLFIGWYSWQDEREWWDFSVKDYTLKEKK